ncbi:BTB/POZ domain-containing protein At1g55760 [Asparagus officinalis]|uniref:BTB/POZ domain-containing protein At1g55760 n=1 Tax=Asparagus officinalis TaxID=4686 RepID=UPI00098E5D91|nr:BTB/POZ domain-containing protein At1g55760 [Asparagus officinalis]
MSDSAYRVETTSRLAQWRIEALSSCTYRKSDPFKIGIWNWFLTVERNKQFYVKLYPETSTLTREQPPVATLNIKIVSSSSPNRKTIVHPGICDKQLKNSDDFVWAIDTPLTGKFIIDVEFLDLKIVPPSGGESMSIWTGHQIETRSLSTSLTSLALMLSDAVLADITITASDGGSIPAHRAVLATRSPVFRSMFSHDLKEKSLSTVHISDMSFDACRAFLNYIYGDFQAKEFLAHRLALLSAADKYSIDDLKEACHDSLSEDIDAKNVLERLQTAHLYGLSKLKSGCLRYLVNFGKVYEIKDEFNEFLLNGDRELISEIFSEVLAAWKGF